MPPFDLSQMPQPVKMMLKPAAALYFRWVRSRWRSYKNSSLAVRRLEIGAGGHRMKGFETLDIVASRHIDYVTDALSRLPFPDETFQTVYASHVLEHLPWFETAAILTEWVRVLAPGGRLEVWVPDGELIARVLLGATEGKPFADDDGWRVRNERSDPFLWANGRLFYGANQSYPSWHKAVFTSKSLTNHFLSAGLVDIRQALPAEYRGGSNHGPINLGVFGDRPKR